MKILVTGGAGFIGSHVVDAYCQAGHEVTVLDDLSTGSKDHVHPDARLIVADIRDASVGKIFQEGRFDILNHHAAQMDVRRSVADPVFDASVNVIGGLHLFEHARRTGVRTIIFASTGGAIYGEQEQFPASEEHPTRPLSPYGITKLCTEKYLYYYDAVHGIRHVVLRYANIYGPRQNPHGEAGVVAIFSNKMLGKEPPVINGDGRQTRDYTYVGDVVTANLLALNCRESEIFNIGTGVETDVNTLFHTLRTHLYPDCPERHGPAKAGEQMRSVITAERIGRKLGWKPAMSLEEGLKHTAEYFRNKTR